MTHVRPAAVAGMFYPGDPETLRNAVRGYLSEARAQETHAAPKALVVPHAGYVYSAPIAANAYARIGSMRPYVRRVVLLGPSHRAPVRGLAAPQAAAFATPLGTVGVDQSALQRIAELPQVKQDDGAHALEHSLEVQLPFLQTLLQDFALVPLAVGRASAEEVAQVLEALWGGDETLLVVSTDLSHYHPYREARDIDQASARQVLALEAQLDHEQACGATPLNGLLLAARRHGLHPELLDLRNSGDTAGDRHRVVGYGAFAFTQEAPHVH